MTRADKLGKRPVTRSARRCIVAGCAERPPPDVLICDVHAEALRPTPDPGGVHPRPMAAGPPGRGT